MMPVNIMILDRDLAFLFWLGQVLALAGYYTYPAANMRDVIRVVPELPAPPDLLIVDAGMPFAELLIRALRGRNAGMAVIGVRAESGMPSAMEGVDHWEDRAAVFDARNAERWRAAVLDVVTRLRGFSAGGSYFWPNNN